MKLLILTTLISTGTSILDCRAQNVAISTDAVTWLNFGTANAEASIAVAKELSIHTGFKYNPWSFKGKEGQMQNRQQTYYAGIRWWPWHIYSGWWLCPAIQYQEYNRGGIRNKGTEQGDAYGLSLSAGYTLMVRKRFNVEFGVGLWGGITDYAVYDCTSCGKLMEQGRKPFLLPNDISIAFMFIF